MTGQKLLLFLAAVALAAVGWFGLVHPGQVRAKDDADTSSLEGKAAPDFSLNTLDGKQLKLSDLKGHAVVLDFWATWCPPCRKSLPHLQSVNDNKELAEKGVKVVAVNAREDKGKVQSFLDENKYHFAVALDSDGKTLKQYMVSGIPTTVIVGKDGTIAKVFVGWGGEETGKEMDQAIAAAAK